VGPVFLIGLGIVFLLVTSGTLSWFSFWDWFGRYWPALLIVWGGFKLYEYLDAQKRGVRPPGIGAGGVFLVILLVMIGMTTQGLKHLPWDDIRDHIQVDGDNPFMGQTFDKTEEMTQDVPANATLHIESQRGSVSVTGSDDNKMHVTAHKKIGANNQADADKLDAASKLQFNGSGNSFTLSTGSPQGWIQTNLEISLPKQASLMINTHRGDTTVSGRDAEVQINGEHGDVTVSNVNGRVSFKGRGDTVAMDHVKGDVDADGNINSVQLSEISGHATIGGSLDEIRLSGIAKGASFRSARTELDIASVTGDLTIDSGDMHGNAIQGPFRLITRSKNIDLTEVAGDVKIQNSDGNISLSLVAPPSGNIDVENKGSDIRVAVPEKGGYRVDASNRHDDITTEFEGVRVSENGEDKTATGTIGSGGGRLHLVNRNGGIEIVRGGSSPVPPKPPEPMITPDTKGPKGSKGPKGPKDMPKPPQVQVN
jgi:DUF4097 and DUF4098 domain-containing protein YvlB